jgi:hypothetical protein
VGVIFLGLVIIPADDRAPAIAITGPAFGGGPWRWPSRITIISWPGGASDN